MHKIKLQPHLQLQDGRVVFDCHNANLMSCNETAFWLLKKLQNGISQDSLTTLLQENYNVDSVAAESDVDQFIRKLNHFSMVEVEE